ncbi:MAG: monovalent cation/H+ antiporter complex subunit F [archaeon]
MMLEAVIVILVLAAIRAVIGPTVPDRVVSLDSVGSIMIFILAFIAYAYKEWYLVDIALVYAFLSFVAVIAISRYLRGDWSA